MREIKFRAWDKKSKIMRDEIAVGNGFCGIQWEDDVNYYYSSHDADLIPMQFTGLKDVKGTEIYEDDFCSHYLCGDTHCTNPQRGRVTIEVSRGVMIGNWPASNHIEKRGNIYENPELLK